MKKHTTHRLAQCLERFGLFTGLTIYLRLRFDRIGSISIPGIQSPLQLRPRNSDKAIFEQVFIRGDYDFDIPLEPRWIIDTGAHIGLFAVLMKNRFPAAKIVCVEPAQQNVRMLAANVGSYAGIYIVEGAVWPVETNLEIVDIHRAGDSALQVREMSEGEVKGIPITNILNKYNIDQVDILKIDIECSEVELFGKNYEDWLPRVRMIIIELHDDLRPGCSQIFFQAVQKCFTNYSVHVCQENLIVVNERKMASGVRRTASE